jgi:uncharacterized membrane protein
MQRIVNHAFIFLVILLTTYGQLILKFRITRYGAMPESITGKVKFVALLFFDPGVLSGFAAAFFASLAWMVAMSKFELGYAYPFMSLNFALVFLASGLVLGEAFSVQRALGIFLIMSGVIVTARG